MFDQPIPCWTSGTFWRPPTAFAFSLMVFGCLLSTASADLAAPRLRPRPQPQPVAGATLLVVVDAQYEKAPKLLIPAKTLQGGQAVREGAQQVGQAGPLKIRTIMAGLALSVALALGGVMAWRSRRGRIWGLGIALVGFFFTGVLGDSWAAWGNAPPPRPPLRKPAPPVAPMLQVNGLQVQVVPQGNAVKLLIGPRLAVQLGQQAGGRIPIPRPLPQPVPRAVPPQPVPPQAAPPQGAAPQGAAGRFLPQRVPDQAAPDGKGSRQPEKNP